MVDWNGLFKWSMKYQDDSKDKSQFKKMDEETKKWIQEAMESYTYNEAKRMKEICAELEKDEDGGEEDGERRLGLLEELQELCEGIENARDLHLIGGLKILIDLIFNTKYIENKLIALQIFCSCNQNNTSIQYASIQYGAFKLINVVLDEKYSIKEKEHAFSALQAMLRGEHLEGKRQFIDAEGIEFVAKVLNDTKSEKIIYKAFSLLRDFVLYDERLHLTINNTELHANTNATTKKFHTEEQKELEKIQNNELPQNEHFKGIVKEKLKKLEIIEKYLESILEDTSVKYTEKRAAFAEILKAMIIKYEDIKKFSTKHFDQIKKHIIKLEELNKNEENCNDYEIEKWKEFLLAYITNQTQENSQTTQSNQNNKPEKMLRL
ncbi:Armadillo-type fold [Pseudocohnilembus persalinus]|uniref:Armadillo-type fold n=1 Tax=Pseudocohnilembus persalinus TaxID=266149 RepID=A0A0V0R0Z1_PSEPJ|nr:Armadillo-type fold [Pseudocohnilembus persalinus]|eukprot:KRX08123.1 Armadillo-type fold [Pseudocohnilembus persalinus]